MSLNRYEEQLFDYIGALPEEERYWRERVRSLATAHDRREGAALALNSELWDYLEERSRHDPVLAGGVGGDGKLSLLNLSEYLLRMWVPLPSKTRR